MAREYQTPSIEQVGSSQEASSYGLATMLLTLLQVPAYSYSQIVVQTYQHTFVPYIISTKPDDPVEG